jgi:hypothetical protein
MRPLKDAMRRLGNTETRPDEAVASTAAGSAPMNLDVVQVDEKIFAVAEQAAVLRLRADAPPELFEAFAALLNLLVVSGPTDVTKRIAELESGQSGLDAELRVALDGPYLATNVKGSRTGLAKNFR